MPPFCLMQRFYPILFVFLWSTGFIGAKYGLPYAEPLSFLLVRYGFRLYAFEARTGNNMGPTQADFGRLFQGAQGTLGVAVWASLRLEIWPRVHRLFFIAAGSCFGALPLGGAGTGAVTSSTTTCTPTSLRSATTSAGWTNIDRSSTARFTAGAVQAQRCSGVGSPRTVRNAAAAARQRAGAVRVGEAKRGSNPAVRRRQ